MIATAPGASTETGTVLPFSAISGAVSVMPPVPGVAPPVKALESSSTVAAKAGLDSEAAARPPRPAQRAVDFH